MKKLFTCLAVLSFVVLTALPVMAGGNSNWTLVYKHTGYGVPLQGAFANLVTAIQEGAAVKFVTHASSGDHGHPALSAAYITSSGTEVVGVFHDWINNPDKTDKILRQTTASTSGLYTYDYEANPYYSSWSTRAYSISWYVNSSDWELIYKHDGNGSAIEGTLQGLVNSVASGAGIMFTAHTPDGDNAYQVIFGHLIPPSRDYFYATVYDWVSTPDKSDLIVRAIVANTNGTFKYEYEQNPYYSNWETNSYEISWFEYK